MLLVYTTKTGNVRRFVDKLDYKSIEITDDLVMNEPYILVTYTIKFGEVPDNVFKFLERDGNHKFMQGVVSSGNRNWGADMFGKAGDIISQTYRVPLIHKIELSGNQKDVDYIKHKLEERT